MTKGYELQWACWMRQKKLSFSSQFQLYFLAILLSVPFSNRRHFLGQIVNYWPWLCTLMSIRAYVEKAEGVTSLSVLHWDPSAKHECLFFRRLLSCLLPPAEMVIYLMPPYETFTAFWMLSTFLLNWMFANKSHGTEGWRDSPSASLWVILPCDAQGKKICISSMTNLAVCFHGDGAHIIYFSPHFPLSFLSAHPFLFPLAPLIASPLTACRCVIPQSSVTSSHSEGKYILHWI